MDISAVLDLDKSCLFGDSWTVYLVKDNDCKTIVAVVNVKYKEYGSYSLDVTVDEELLLQTPYTSPMMWIAPYLGMVDKAIEEYITTEA